MLTTVFFEQLKKLGIVYSLNEENGQRYFSYDEEYENAQFKPVITLTPDAPCIKAKIPHSCSSNVESDFKSPKRPEASESVVIDSIHTLNLSCLGIHSIDAKFKQFRNLSELNVSRNKLSSIENIPPALNILHAYGNRIESINIECPLVQLGLGYNSITSLDQIKLTHPSSILSLDLSSNDMCDMQHTLDSLSSFSSLKHLYLEGNPFCLIKSYRSIVMAALPNILVLDGAPTSQISEVPSFCDDITLTLHISDPLNLPIFESSIVELNLDSSTITANSFHSYFLALRAGDNEIIESSDCLSILKKFSFKPSALWRNFIKISGFDVCLFHRVHYVAQDAMKKVGKKEKPRKEVEQKSDIDLDQFSTTTLVGVARCVSSSIFAIPLSQNSHSIKARVPFKKISEEFNPLYEYLVAECDTNSNDDNVTPAHNSRSRPTITRQRTKPATATVVEDDTKPSILFVLYLNQDAIIEQAVLNHLPTKTKKRL